MPRGAEYANEPPASDNAIESGENKIAGADVRNLQNPPPSFDLFFSVHIFPE